MIQVTQELPYAKQFADALVNDSAFCSWFMGQTAFPELAGEAILLKEDIFEKRYGKAKERSDRYWWRHNYQEKCRCVGCSGQETDVLAIFKTAAIPAVRFAMHVEVKYPGDDFDKSASKNKKIGQAEAYPIRAACWVAKAPNSVLPHHKTTTAVLFSERDRAKFANHLKHFCTKKTFEEIEESFPNLFNKTARYLILFFKGSSKKNETLIDTKAVFGSLQDAIGTALAAVPDYAADRVRIIDVDADKLPIWNYG